MQNQTAIILTYQLNSQDVILFLILSAAVLLLFSNELRQIDTVLCIYSVVIVTDDAFGSI